MEPNDTILVLRYLKQANYVRSFVVNFLSGKLLVEGRRGGGGRRKVVKVLLGAAATKRDGNFVIKSRRVGENPRIMSARSETSWQQ